MMLTVFLVIATLLDSGLASKCSCVCACGRVCVCVCVCVRACVWVGGWVWVCEGWGVCVRVGVFNSTVTLKLLFS